MDGWTLHLLGLAVANCGGHLELSQTSRGWAVISQGLRRFSRCEGPTLADALAALLRDLGVEVPERPSAERVQRALMRFENLHPEDDWDLEDLRELDAREPLIVDAMLGRLEGGE